MKSIIQNTVLKFVVPTCLAFAAGYLLYKRKSSHESEPTNKANSMDNVVSGNGFEGNGLFSRPVESNEIDKNSAFYDQCLTTNPLLLIRKLSISNRESILVILDALAVQCRNEKIQQVVMQSGNLATLCELCKTEQRPDVLYRALSVLMNFSLRHRHLGVFESTEFGHTLFYLLEKYLDKSIFYDESFLGSDASKVLQYTLLCMQNITFHPDGCSLFPAERAVPILLQLQPIVLSVGCQKMQAVSHCIEKCLLHYQLAA